MARLRITARRARWVWVAAMLCAAGCGSDRVGGELPDGSMRTQSIPDAGSSSPAECTASAQRACDCGADAVGNQTCVDGEWGSCLQCRDPEFVTCTEGQTVPCDCSATQSGLRPCVNERFGACRCDGTTSPACEEGAQQSCDCGADHVGTQECLDGVWTSCGQCVDPASDCTGGQTRTCTCPGGDDGRQTCTGDSWSACDCEGSTSNPCNVHPDCSRYASKMRSCYPNWGADHLAGCDQMFDICDLGDGCNAHYPAHVRCVLNNSCATITGGGCPASCS